MGLDLDLLLLLAALVLKNRINGGGNLSVRAGLEMVFDGIFMFLGLCECFGFGVV